MPKVINCRRVYVVDVGGVSFTLGKLTLDDVRDWDEKVPPLRARLAELAAGLDKGEGDTAAMVWEIGEVISGIEAAQMRACATALERGGTPPAQLGKIDKDEAAALLAEVMTFSRMLGAKPGESASP